MRRAAVNLDCIVLKVTSSRSPGLSFCFPLHCINPESRVNTPTPKNRTSTPGPETSSPPATPTFESSLEEVEHIIERIERGEVGLEDSLTQYEKGVELIRRCRGILKQAELRVEELTQRMQDADPPDNPA